jgi:5-methyltetrahydropteroyltriglutamate--homocysteine methyltransferase
VSEKEPKMKHSSERILSTHTGSLARSPELRRLLVDRDAGTPIDREQFDATVRRSVAGVVRRQAEAGLSSINDGEQSKIGFANYVTERLDGFGGTAEPRPMALEAREFPEWATSPARAATGFLAFKRPACDRPVAWKDFGAVETDIENLKAAAQGIDAEIFMTAVSPGTLANFFPNRYYPSREAYLSALAEVMKREYEAIARAGFLLQLDCPDLALRSTWFPDLSIDEFRSVVALNLEALNGAIATIPPDQMRMHVCWGAGETPHSFDVPLRDIVDLLLTTRAGALSIVGANGRHEHEWQVWEDVGLPSDKILIPGVIDSTTNIVEHPQVVAERIVRYANVVGRENVIAGVDCGFATSSTSDQVDGEVAWAKLRALTEGAELASKQLWAHK